MNRWANYSDKKGRFFDGGESQQRETLEAFRELFDFFMEEIVRKRTTEFDLMLLEIGCDTGRILLAVTTTADHKKGVADGCSIRVQAVQDYWYDLTDRGIKGADFERGVSTFALDIGMTFRLLITSHVADIKAASLQSGFVFRVYGATPGNIVYEEHI